MKIEEIPPIENVELEVKIAYGKINQLVDLVNSQQEAIERLEKMNHEVKAMGQALVNHYNDPSAHKQELEVPIDDCDTESTNWPTVDVQNILYKHFYVDEKSHHKVIMADYEIRSLLEKDEMVYEKPEMVSKARYAEKLGIHDTHRTEEDELLVGTPEGNKTFILTDLTERIEKLEKREEARKDISNLVTRVTQDGSIVTIAFNEEALKEYAKSFTEPTDDKLNPGIAPDPITITGEEDYTIPDDKPSEWPTVDVQNILYKYFYIDKSSHQKVMKADYELHNLLEPVDDTHRTVTLRIPKDMTVGQAVWKAWGSLDMSDTDLQKALDEVQE